MTTTAQAGAADVATTDEFVLLDPSTIVIGTNVRTDTRVDEKEFRKSIKERGVLEAVTVYRDEDGQPVLLRGQRRTIAAAEVGTPTGLIPARVVPQPEDAERIGDQMVENIHRVAMRDSEVVAGVEQLALLGVTAAQIAKRTSIARPTVNAALRVTKAEQSRERLESGYLTLQQAGYFAEFEHDPDAIARLESATRWGHPMDHLVQRLRDEAAEREVLAAEIERLRSEGLPVLTIEEVAEAEQIWRIDRLLTADGDPVPADERRLVPGARVQVVKEWVYPEDMWPEDTDAETDTEDSSPSEPEEVYDPVWVVTDLDASGLKARGLFGLNSGHGKSSETEEEAEARRAERRLVIANNKAWVSAEKVRREWLSTFLARKAAPKGAESLICEAVVGGNFTVSRAIESRHPMLFQLLGIDIPATHYGAAGEACHTLATKAHHAKGLTMTTLAAVVAAWEASTGKHTWRNPARWDARVLGALIEWGYVPSDVERLLIDQEASNSL